MYVSLSYLFYLIFNFRVPENFNFWGEEEVRRLHELQSNEVIVSHFRRQKSVQNYCFFLN